MLSAPEKSLERKRESESRHGVGTGRCKSSTDRTDTGQDRTGQDRTGQID